ncbi:colicin release lysis protein [Salmonella enterica]|nr:lysis protein [Salmonella enterica]EBR5147873.1 lysis protein [Salmonella enterica]EEL1126393.1 colicin release lysis protein [Salmonella enterica]EHJ8492544.1 colicin release lysis protein [Salmonella enterica]EIP4192426.1 colicin release lysis protein [Salmonella enterica]
MKKSIFIIICTVFMLAGCQANYVRDVHGGTIAPSSSSKLTGIAVQ